MTTLYDDALAVTVEYDYDSRDRCTQIRHNGDTLADYSFDGRAMTQRDVTCDYTGSTKPKFKTVFVRDDLYRVLTARSRHLTLDQADAGFNDLSTRTYAYDARSNVISDLQSGGMGGWLGASRQHEYDTLDRLTRKGKRDITDC